MARCAWAGASIFLGRTAKDQGHYSPAAAHLAESLALFRELDYRDAVAFTLEGFAGLAAARGPHPEGAIRAARLFGAAEAFREAIRSPMAPVDRPEYDRDVAAARAQLDEAAFEAAWREGRTMPWEEVVASVLAEEERPGSNGEHGHPEAAR
ncbi:MAG: hypothetical protein M3380_15420 [Chloroflexota bacterium]|nr:hypothetical protein [Chloroflexota bacterium]